MKLTIPQLKVLQETGGRDERLRNLKRSSDPEDQLQYARELKRTHPDSILAQTNKLNNDQNRWQSKNLDYERLFDLIEVGSYTIQYVVPTGETVTVDVSDLSVTIGDGDNMDNIGHITQASADTLFSWGENDDPQAEQQYWHELNNIVMNHLHY